MHTDREEDNEEKQKLTESPCDRVPDHVCEQRVNCKLADGSWCPAVKPQAEGWRGR